MAVESQNSHSRVEVVLVRPERPVNVGSAARATANMGLGGLRIVGDPSILRDEAWWAACHARPLLEQASFFPDLATALRVPGPSLSLATSARVGSADRPHPLGVREALARAAARLEDGAIEHLFLVFGAEGDGLDNADIALCDQIVTIPTASEYRTLNLAQAVMVVTWEASQALLARASAPEEPLSQAPFRRLVDNLLQLAEDVHFIRPDDPRKMKPRLEGIFSSLSRRDGDVATLHGLVAQIRRHLVVDGVPQYYHRSRPRKSALR